MTKHLPMPENVITEIAKPQNVCFTIVCKYSDSLSKQLFKNIHIISDGIQGVRTGSREPVLGISARLANPFLEFQHV